MLSSQVSLSESCFALVVFLSLATTRFDTSESYQLLKYGLKIPKIRWV